MIKLLLGLIIIFIDKNYNLLYNFSNINYINIYLLVSFILTAFNTSHLQGTTYRKNKMPSYKILFISKFNFIMLMYSLIYNLNFNNLFFNNLFLLYLPYYLEFSEFKGNRKLNLYNPLIKFAAMIFKSFGYYEIINNNNIIDNNKQYLLAIYPHGIIPVGSIGCFVLPICKNIKNTIPILLGNNIHTGVASFCFYIPLLRDLFLFVGAIDCSKPIIEKFIKNNYSIALFVGGAEEAKFSGYGNTNIIVKSRKGFLKLALENNLTIVPIYTFGNNNIYKSYDKDFYNIFYYFKRITGIWFPRGKIILTKNNFVSVIGKEINVNNNDILELQTKYINNLNEVFEKYKHLDSSIKDKYLLIN
tara:strand:- start:186 stop:1262 length:1077 start_codon:yes stop_codon:yes gene_type:complete